MRQCNRAASRLETILAHFLTHVLQHFVCPGVMEVSKIFVMLALCVVSIGIGRDVHIAVSHVIRVQLANVTGRLEKERNRMEFYWKKVQ